MNGIQVYIIKSNETEEYNMDGKKYISVSFISLQMCKVKNMWNGLRICMEKQQVKLRALGEEWRHKKEEHGGGRKQPKEKR